MKTWDHWRKVEGNIPQSLNYIDVLEQLYNLDIIHEIEFWSYAYKKDYSLVSTLLKYFHMMNIE